MKREVELSDEYSGVADSTERTREAEPYGREEWYLASAAFHRVLAALRSTDMKTHHYATLEQELPRLLETARRGVEANEDATRLDWLEGQNAIVRGESPILPPSCGFSVRKYIDQRIADAASPQAARAARVSDTQEGK